MLSAPRFAYSPMIASRIRKLTPTRTITSYRRTSNGLRHGLTPGGCDSMPRNVTSSASNLSYPSSTASITPSSNKSPQTLTLASSYLKICSGPLTLPTSPSRQTTHFNSSVGTPVVAPPYASRMLTWHGYAQSWNKQLDAIHSSRATLTS